MTDRRTTAGVPRGALAGPLAILAVGIVAGAALWGVLLRGAGPDRTPEHLTQDDRAALAQLLQRR